MINTYGVWAGRGENKRDSRARMFDDEDVEQNRRSSHGRDIVQPSERAQGVYEKGGLYRQGVDVNVPPGHA